MSAVLVGVLVDGMKIPVKMLLKAACKSDETVLQTRATM